MESPHPTADCKSTTMTHGERFAIAAILIDVIFGQQTVTWLAVHWDTDTPSLPQFTAIEVSLPGCLVCDVTATKAIWPAVHMHVGVYPGAVPRLELGSSVLQPQVVISEGMFGKCSMHTNVFYI